MSFVSASSSQGSCSQASGTVSCQLDRLAEGTTAKVTITAKTLRFGLIPNTATVDSYQTDPYPPTNTVVSRAVVSAPGCGRVITQGTVLTSDLGPCGANGIVVGADNVTLDLGGHTIYGFDGPSGPTGDQAGIRLPQRTGVTVKNGTVSDFDAGVVVRGGAANTLTKLTAKRNIGPDDAFDAALGDGIFIEDSASNRVVGNTLTENGIFDGIGVYGPQSNSNVVENNVIEDTKGPSDGGPAGQGIIINGATAGTTPTHLESTRVAGNLVRGSASAGIANINHVKGSILGNTVENNGRTNSVGNGIGVSVGFVWRGPTGMLIQGNKVHGNGVDG
ncbi:MAG: right-handed parallel beta-helix repeat-containing protein, partial [Actinobacteria bacterium]|nr:right-handed parallel beta-helix repeat-containing protein [Actinomycetota bacterium]